MRELKFRVWSEEDREYRTDCDVFRLFHGKTGCPATIYSDEGDRFDIEQYTGLKDKNGKEIYDGDILGGIWESGFISWCEKCKQFQYHSAGIGCMACSGDVHWCEIVEDDGKLEIIGNIHENPELLEEEE